MYRAFIHWCVGHVWLTLGAFVVVDGLTDYLVICAGVPEKHPASYVVHLLRIVFFIPIPGAAIEGIENRPRRIGLLLFTLTVLVAYVWAVHFAFIGVCSP